MHTYLSISIHFLKKQNMHFIIIKLTAAFSLPKLNYLYLHKQTKISLSIQLVESRLPFDTNIEL